MKFVKNIYTFFKFFIVRNVLYFQLVLLFFCQSLLLLYILKLGKRVLPQSNTFKAQHVYNAITCDPIHINHLIPWGPVLTQSLGLSSPSHDLIVPNDKPINVTHMIVGPSQYMHDQFFLSKTGENPSDQYHWRGPMFENFGSACLL